MPTVFELTDVNLQQLLYESGDTFNNYIQLSAHFIWCEISLNLEIFFPWSCCPQIVANDRINHLKFVCKIPQHSVLRFRFYELSYWAIKMQRSSYHTKGFYTNSVCDFYVWNCTFFQGHVQKKIPFVCKRWI